MFSFEAGRRCDSGPGNFTFETKQGNEVFGIVEAAIRAQKAQAEERHQSGPASDTDPAPGREADGDSGGSKPGSADGVFGRREGGCEGKNLKARSLPDPPAPPLREDQGALYSEPADSLRPPPPSAAAADCLYSDPVDSIKATPTPAPRNPGNKPEPLYSDIYDRVDVDLAPRAGALGLEARPKGAEHIYDEPEGRGEGGGAGLYDEARPQPQAWRSRALADSPLGHEFPYNPSTDDYSVPAYGRPQAPPPRAKGPKPLPAPKPAKGILTRNQNANNNNRHTDLYSQVSRHKPPPNSCHPPDIIYDNLGDI